MNHWLLAALLLTTPNAWAADNPMWRSGFAWSCAFSSVLRCKRTVDCAAAPEEGVIRLDYRENRLTDFQGTVHPIKRHYVQSVPASPIGSEVKIELDTNEVIWLAAADGARMFSDNWIGAMLSPKAGVIVRELRPLVCKPTK
ncbi:hypothetical protein [Shinella sp. M31]|uniref:hypothetical protein n=1 Tax=Shinella sp. M31 TaxID=3368615 RepID=UPI003BA013DF